MLSFFQDKVHKPRNTKLVYTVDFNKNNIVEKEVTLTLETEQQKRRRASTGPAAGGSYATKLSHSVSTPQLQGAWNMRNLENAVPPMDNARTRGKKILMRKVC